MLKQEMLFAYIRHKVWANTVIFIYGKESAKRLKLVYDRRMMLILNLKDCNRYR
jgi:hypothetical protein